ncbi:DUF2971 domain-containing protein [Solibacillus daqui]|uniref:DUF2971 domain-containing protein n=1 Tax=Solibacillus daqui TaxID=2912187 RepID=UPI002366DE85|nr:DUF2971 domain-containing protein [Solibacillus daqui]
MGKVKYIDYSTERNFHGNTLSPFFTKRISFSHENEVRLLYSNNIDFNEEIYGKNIKVDLTELIECIYVSPDAPLWFVDVVKVVVNKFNIQSKIIHSDLYKIN